jgi:hypothetical protein
LSPHDIAAGQLFRWRVQFGLDARKTPQFATMTLADGALNQGPALCTSAGSGSAAGRMMAIMMEIAQPA